MSPGTDGTGRVIELPPRSLWMFPVDPTPAEVEAGLYMKFVDTPDPLSRYAGFHRDLFLSADVYHTHVGESQGTGAWRDEDGNSLSFRDPDAHATEWDRYRLMHYRAEGYGLSPTEVTWGPMWTNQSTTLMGNNRSDLSYNALSIEKDFYFRNVLRAGPGFTSVQGNAGDSYEVYLPSFFNTIGASPGVPPAYEKMIGAAAYMQEDLKRELLRNGLFMSTMLYTWKAALPYQVSFGHEARHRVAYYGRGMETRYPPEGPAPDVFDHYRVFERHPYYHNSRHMANMVGLLKDMAVAPPVSLLAYESHEGGTLNYEQKTAIALRQQAGESVELIVDVTESFDLQDFPLEFHWALSYGDKRTTVEDLGSGRFRIRVPAYSADMPGGRTVVLFYAHNGVYAGNPAAVNIYRKYATVGDIPVEDPLLSAGAVEPTTLLPGETLAWELFSFDVGGYPVSWYQWEGAGGDLDGSRFTLSPPVGSGEYDEEVALVATTGLSGNDHAGKVARVAVRHTVAEIAADVRVGEAPLTVNFDASASRDIDGNVLEVAWDFDDGSSSSSMAPAHTFTDPGYYEVRLTVSGPHGSHTTTELIHVRHTWPLALNNGWDASGIDAAVWEASGSVELINNGQLADGQRTPFIEIAANHWASMESVDSFETPLYIEVDYTYEIGHQRWIDVFGYGIGHVGGENRGSQVIGFGVHDDASFTWSELEWIGAQKKNPHSIHQLRLYVTDDPEHPGKIRFRGTITTDAETLSFSIGNKDKLKDTVGVRGALDRKVPTTPPAPDQGTGDGAELNLYACRLWSPEGGVNEGLLQVETESGDLLYPKHSLANHQRWALRRTLVSEGRDFGMVPVNGGFSEKTYTLHNRGAAALNVTGMSLEPSWANNGVFSVDGPTSGSIPAGGSFDITVRYAPKETGPLMMRLKITSDDPVLPTYNIWLRGFGKGGAPELSVEGENRFVMLNGDSTPNRFDGTDAGEVMIGESIQRTFLIQNASWADLEIHSVGISGSPDFAVVRAPSGTIPPQGSRSVVVSYTPLEPGVDTATLTLSSSDSTQSTFAFDLAGEGLPAGTPQLLVQGSGQSILPGDRSPSVPDGTDFGVTAVGEGGMRQRSYVFSNTGDAPLTLDSIEISGSGADRFGLKRTLPTVLPAGASLTVPVAFASDTAGTFAADVIVTSNDPSNGTYPFGIQGQTDAALASATMTTSTGYQLSNGENTPNEGDGTATAPLNGGETGTLSFTIRNNSASVSIHTLTVSLSGEDAGAFSVTTPPVTPLPPGSATTVEIQAHPDASGTFNATVRFDLNPVADMPFTFTVQSTALQDAIRFYEGPILDEEGNEVTVRKYFSGSEGRIGRHTLRIERSGSGVGEASVDVVVDLDAGYPSPAQEDDFIFTPQTLHWADGEVGIKEVEIEILDDEVPEPTETIRIYLRNPAGNTGPIPDDAYFSLNILNDDFVEVLAQTFSAQWGFPFDLNGKCLVLRPNGDGGYHPFLKEGVSSFPRSQAGATVISSSDQPIANDESHELRLPAGFTIPFFGTHHSALFLGGNGSITLGEDRPLSGTFIIYSSLFDPLFNPVPRIALFLDSSLRPENGGEISYEVIQTVGEERVVISYLNIPHVSGGVLANAQLEILKSGELRLYWLGSATTVSDYTTIGISPGAIPGAAMIDLSGLPTLMDYEQWAGGIDWGDEDSSRDGDPNGNQITNFEEFLYGFTDPVNGTGSFQQNYQSGADAGGVSTTYTYRRNARAWGVRFVDQVSFDLEEWHDIDPASASVEYRVTPVPDSDQEEVTLILRDMGDALFQRTKMVTE